MTAMNGCVSRFAVMITVATWAVVLVEAQPCAAGNADEELVVGRGGADFEKLAPEVQDNIRRPGVSYIYNEPPEHLGDLPPARVVDTDEVTLPYPDYEPETIQPLPAPQAVNDPTLEELRDAELRREAQEPVQQESAPPDIPSDALQRAREHIQKMPVAEPHPAPPSPGQPQSLLQRLLIPLLLSPAYAQSYQWVQIGPEPAQTTTGTNIAGRIRTIVLDPNNSQRLFQGGDETGVWGTSTLGSMWTPLTDSQPNLQVPTLAILPNSTNPTYTEALFAGTGFTGKGPPAAGILRSTDGGTNWCRIGPNADGSPGPYASTTLPISEIAVDRSKETPSQPSVRVWAATLAGLFWSENAHSAACDSVTWTKVTTLPAWAVETRHIFLSPRNQPCNKEVIYAAICGRPCGNQTCQYSCTWYRSTDRGNTTSNWTNVTNGSTDPNATIDDAAIAQCPQAGCNCTTGTDTIYEKITSGSISGLLCTTNFTLWRTTDSGASWQRVVSADCLNAGNKPGETSIALHPTNPNIIAYGLVDLWRSMDGGATFAAVNAGHADYGSVVFDGNTPDRVFIGSDGGMWYTNSFTAPYVSWTNLNTNISTILFYDGEIDRLNYGVSQGGTQDNGTLKGGTPLVWTIVPSGFGDTGSVRIDPANSRIAYACGLGFDTGSGVHKTEDGWATWYNANLSSCPILSVDPTDRSTVAFYSGQDVQSSHDGGTTWLNLGTIGTGYSAQMIARTATAPSNIYLDGNCGFLKRTVNATSSAPTWTTHGSGTFPSSRCVTSLTGDPTVSCTSTQGIMYAAFDGYENPSPGASGRHVFRSSDAGQTWIDASGAGSTGLPDLPVRSLAVHPQDPNTIYAGTALGVFQGTFNPTTSTTTWGTLMNGLPAAADVRALVTHKDSGIMRAFTYGRSVWETRLFSVPNPDLKVNTTTNPTNPTPNAVSPRVSSGTGNPLAVSWVDDRNGANNAHVYFQAYNYNGTSIPTALAAQEFRVDDTFSTHSVQSVSLSADPISNLPSICARLAWSDDRQNPTVDQHVYAGAMCSDGYKLFVHDISVDQNPVSLDATQPGIAFQPPNRDFAIAWQSQRASNPVLRDINARFFDTYGNAKNNQFKINILASPAGTDTDARRPAIMSDGNGNVFVGWEEYVYNTSSLQTVAYRVLLAKYDLDGQLMSLPFRIDDSSGDPNTTRSHVSLATDGSGNLIATWRESVGTGPERIVGKRFNGSLTSSALLDAQCRICSGGSKNKHACATNADCPGGTCLGTPTVSCPPGKPIGAQRAVPATIAQDGTGNDIATDTTGNVVVTWQGNANDPSASPAWSAFARSFNSSLGILKNDFRVDLAGRAATLASRTARTAYVGKFAFVWRDNRAGRYDVYLRAAQAQ